MGSVRLVNGYILKEILIGEQVRLFDVGAFTELDRSRRPSLICVLFTRRSRGFALA